METKLCPSCNEVKQLNEYYKNGGKCKPCQHLYNKNHNLKNKNKYKKYQKKSNKMVYDRGQTFINKHKALCGCLKCGEKRYWVIDYHHIHPEEKTHSIPYYKTAKLETLKSEMKKCITLCRNCHTDFHHQEKKIGISIKEYVHL